MYYIYQMLLSTYSAFTHSILYILSFISTVLQFTGIKPIMKTKIIFGRRIHTESYMKWPAMCWFIKSSKWLVNSSKCIKSKEMCLTFVLNHCQCQRAGVKYHAYIILESVWLLKNKTQSLLSWWFPYNRNRSVLLLYIHILYLTRFMSSVSINPLTGHNSFSHSLRYLHLAA